MITNMIRLVLLLALWLATTTAFAVTGVNPTGVNVRSSGATTVFLTFQNLDSDEDALESFWCGELIAPLPVNQVFNFNPCNPATIFGRLPAKLDRSTVSGTGGRRNLTDIMTIPASVTRRALQSAQAGQASQFFYVRRFSSGLFVVVTCRMAGGGARSPLALTEVRMGFLNEQRELLLDPIYPVAVGATLPPVGAYIRYTGAGRLKGRWEVALPGDPPPSEFDLFTEGALPVEQRGLQRRYSILERFEIFLTPVGEAFVPGPRALEPPTQAGGLHRILLRIEASDDRDSRSNTGGGLVASAGGVAGFALPQIRYFVGSSERDAAPVLLAPGDGAPAPPKPLEFSWRESAPAPYYRLEVTQPTGETVLAAVVKGGTGYYAAPPWLADRAGEPLRWRVVALDDGGRTLVASDWRSLRIARP